MLEEISKSKDKTKHVVYKKLIEKRATIEKQKEEPENNLKKLKTKELDKV